MQQEHAKEIKKLRRQLVVIGQRSAFHSANRVPPATRKLSGQARINTKLTVGQQDLTNQYANPYGPNFFIGELANRTAHFAEASKEIKLGDTAFVTNNLHYIQDLEYRRGDLMFNKAAQAWPQDVRKGIRDSRRVLR